MNRTLANNIRHLMDATGIQTATELVTPVRGAAANTAPLVSGRQP